MKEENSDPFNDLSVQSEDSNSMGEIILVNEGALKIKIEPDEEQVRPRKRQR